MWCVYIYNGILLSHKKNEILPFATTWMDLEGIIPSEISQTEKDKSCMISLTCAIYKIQQLVNITTTTKNRLTDIENK